MKRTLQLLALLFSVVPIAGCAAATPTPGTEPESAARAPSVIAEGRLFSF